MIHLTGAIGLFLPFPFLKHKQTYYIQKNVSSKKTFEFFAGIEKPDIFPIAIWGLPGVFENEIPLAERLIISGLSEALESENSLVNASRFLEAGGAADLGLNHGGKYIGVDCSDRFLPGTLSIDAGIQNSYPLQYEIQESGLDTEPSRYGWMMANQPCDSVRISLSSISPPLGDIGRIPRVITWMIDREERPETVDRALDGRVFDLSEIARLTRLEPARQLGFNELGHLKTGAAASVVIYDFEPGKSSGQMVEALSKCWCLIKEGVVVRENGSFTNAAPPAKIRYRKMDTELAMLKQTALLQNPTLRLENLSITNIISL
jgi:hypothetical protein